jgi:pimeloyl-ACP methyl ester carboxylesterase
VLNRRFASRALHAGVRDAASVTKLDVEAYLLPAEAPGASGAFVTMLREADFGSTADQLHKVTQPALIIWGANDPWLSVRYAHRMAADLEGSKLVVFQECGHLPPEENPEAFSNEVLVFLRGLHS